MRIVVDAFHFVGLAGGSGGSGTYIMSLIEGLARLADVRVLASQHNARHFRAISERARRLTILTGGDNHAVSLREAVEDTDIVYAPFTALPERSTYPHVPAVTAIHDLQHRILKSFFPEAERIDRDNAYFDAVTEADAVLTFSQSESKNIADFYGVQHRIGVVPHAPFLAEEVLRGFGNSPADPVHNPYVNRFGRYLLYPAVDWPHKNHYRLLEAMRLLIEEFSITDVKLVLPGAACVEQREHFYKELLNQPWASQSVVKMGFVSSVQLFMLMKGAEGLVFPSLYEGFGIPVLEAMRLGTPVIASDLPVMQEWFSDCYDPFRNVRDSYAMAADLARFLRDSQRRHDIQQRALSRSMNFSSKRTAEETVEFLSTVNDEFSSGARRHARPYRDIAALLKPTYRLLLHILLDTVDPIALDRAIASVEKARGAATSEVGVVWICPYHASPDNAVTAARQRRRRARQDNQPHEGDPAGLITSLLPRLAAVGDIVYFDETDPLATRARAIRFTATQVEAAFHCFVAASAFVQAGDDSWSEFGRQVDAALSTDPDVEGFYVGDAPLVTLRDQISNLLYSRLGFAEEEISKSDIASHNFVLKKTSVLSAGVQGASAVDWFATPTAVQLVLREREIIEPRRRFAYVETELASPVGHPFALLQGLCGAAAGAGLIPLAGVNREGTGIGTGGAMVFDPCFSTYWEAPEAHVTPTHFADELLSFMERHRLGPRDYVYLHMPYPTLIAGALQLIVSRRLDELPVFLIRVCSIDESFRWHDIKETSLLQTIEQLGAARRSRIRIFAESVPLQEYFEAQTGKRLPILLNPVNRLLVAKGLVAAELRQRRRQDNKVVFGYFGEARLEKGFLLVPDIVEKVLNKHTDDHVQFRIQVSATVHNDNEEVQAARRRLEELAERYSASGAVALYRELPDMNGYYDALAECDAVLLPYDPVAYKVRGSGVALESIALGVAIVVTAETDMARTFAGPGCIVCRRHDADAFADCCSEVVENVAGLSEKVQEFARTSPLVCSEREYMQALTSYVPDTGDAPEERHVAIWIGNEVLAQGCSAVYEAQRGFLRREGYEIYNVYVPFPDLGGFVPADETLEKRLVSSSLGWEVNGFDFGCYSWMLNQFDDEFRPTVLDDIATQGGSTERFMALNAYNQCPAGLLRLVEARQIDLVVLNYVHLLPVVENLGLLNRKGTRVVLETHDIQAYQHAIRAGRAVDEEDKELEIGLYSQADAVVAISRKEHEEILERNPWVRSEFVLPAMPGGGTTLRDWLPGALPPSWLALWYERGDLRTAFDLSVAESLSRFRRWIIEHGRLEAPELPLDPAIETLANQPHPDFPASDGGNPVTNVVGWMWERRQDLQMAFPKARDPDHEDRLGLLRWCATRGEAEARIDADGKLLSPATASQERGGAPLEAWILSQPREMEDQEYRSRMIAAIRQTQNIDVMIVASDHPSNVSSVRWFIEEVYTPHLAPHGVSLLLAGLCGNALDEDEIVPGMIVVGAVSTLDPWYRIARVVAIPTSAGSGTPIKVLDAFARGLCVSSFSFIDQALDLRRYGFPMLADASGFAADIRHLLASEDARDQRIAMAKRFNADHLDIEVYDAKWRVLAGIPPRPSAPRDEVVDVLHAEEPIPAAEVAGEE